MSAPRATVPVAPLVEWLAARLEQHRGSATALACELGVTPRTLLRYRRGLASDGKTPAIVYDRTTIDLLLAEAGAGLWEVYPEQAEAATEPTAPALHITAFCPRCEVACVPMDDGTCGWCGAQTGGGDVVGPVRPGRLRAIDEEVLLEAKRLYADGRSMGAVATALLHRTTYKTAASAAASLNCLFRARGWPLRERADALRVSNRARFADVPQCSHVHPDGRRCETRTRRPTGTCGRHDPDRLAASIALLRQRDAQAA